MKLWTSESGFESLLPSMFHLILALHTPLDPLHNDGYQFWSGIGSDLAYIAAVLALFRHWNCHEPKCWRHGRYQLAEGTRVCKKHDPRYEGDHHPGVALLWRKHQQSNILVKKGG